MRFGFLSTYPPTQCGLATFTEALVRALDQLPDCDSFVVRSVEQRRSDEPPGVVHQLVGGDSVSSAGAVGWLNTADVAVVQHEYGIYGGPDGRDVVPVVRRLQVPLVVVLHTVLTRPTPAQRAILEEICGQAGAVVTMSHAAKDRLVAGYDVRASKVRVIPHGAELGASAIEPVANRILTWGLIGPGKGIEWGVDALARLRDLDRTPHYLVAGQTHPKVAEREGERYRESLLERARDLGVSDQLQMDASYRPTEAMAALIGSASVVLLPYDSTEQITSGVLIEAVAAGRPVIATAFPHAVELLRGGVGITVKHRDPAAMAAALRLVLTDPVVAQGMRTAATSAGRNLGWPAVARQYRDLARWLQSSTSGDQAAVVAS